MTDGLFLPVKIGEAIAGKYLVERVIGTGGMGVVLSVMHIDLGERRAIKLMHPRELGNARAVERFMREPRAAARLRSEHVARIYDTGKLESGAPYIVMEYLEGIDLRALLQDRGALPVDTAALYMLQACDAIEEAHAAGILHRDLKPANLFLTTRASGEPCIKVLDFGIAKLIGRAVPAELTTTKDVVGSPHYMSPEQMRSLRDVDARTDIWALGVILYELVTGRRPFPGELAPEVHAMVLSGSAPRPPSSIRPELPPELDSIILRCLEKERAYRTSSVAALRTELYPFAKEPGRISRISIVTPSSQTPLPTVVAAPASEPTERHLARPSQPRAAPAEDIRKREAPPAKSWANADLRGRDFAGQDLRFTDLSGANLTGARLAGANLTSASLRNARLVRADLTRARLTRADLRGADLSLARLLGADLRGASLVGASLRGAKLTGAQVDEGALDPCDSFGAALPAALDAAPMTAAASPCEALAFSPTGALLASGHKDGSVRLLDPEVGVPLRILQGSAEVWSLAFRPDETLVAAGSRDGLIRLWDVETGAEERVLAAGRGPVLSVAWSPNRTTLASGHWDGAILLWDPVTGALRRALEGHRGSVRSAVFSPDGLLLASGALDRTVRLWNVSTGRELGTLGEHASEIRSIAFSPDGSMLVGALLDRTFRLWSASTGAEQRVFGEREGAVGNAAISRDGRTLAGGCMDNIVRLWNVTTGAVQHALTGHTSEIRSVAWSPSGHALASGSLDGTARIWSASRGAALHVLSGHTSSACSIAFSPGGSALASSSADGTIRLWDTATGSGRRVLAVTSTFLRGIAISPDGAQLAGASGGSAVYLWKGSASAPGASIRGVAWSPDGAQLAGASADGTIRLWDLGGGAPSPEPRAIAVKGGTPVHVAVFSPDGARLAGGCQDATVRLWDSATSAEQHAFAGHSGAVWTVAFQPGGPALASGSADKSVRLWDTSTGELKRALPGHSGEVRSVAWSPDGARLASGSDDRTVMLWDPTAGIRRRVLTGHTGAVHHVAWSPDGASLASSSTDGTVRLWHAGSGLCIAVLLHLPSGWAAFTPDGRYRLGGDLAGAFWHVIGLCRFEPPELEPHLAEPLLLLEGAQLAPDRPDAGDQPGEYLLLDARPLLRDAGELWRISYARCGSVPALLNHIYQAIHGGGTIPPFTYGKRWVLREAASGRVLTSAIIALKDGGRRVEDRRLRDVGIEPGATLEIISPPPE